MNVKAPSPLHDESTQSKPPLPELQFVCINCGHLVDSLYKKYSSSVLKIIECKNCSEVADKYIEFEPIVIVIDIVLLSREAYRHVLYNTHFWIRWKLAVVLVLLESYFLTKDKRKYDGQNVQLISSEQLFYVCFMLCIIDKLILCLLLSAMSTLANCYRQHKPHPGNSLASIVIKCITLGSVTKFFLLPAVIWHNNISETEIVLHELMVGAYYFIALVQIFSVLINCSRWTALLMVATSMVVKQMLDYELNKNVEWWL